MGNFEKLGILVIIVLVVTILVLTFWGMSIPLPENGAVATPKSLSGEDEADPTRTGSGTNTSPNRLEAWPENHPGTEGITNSDPVAIEPIGGGENEGDDPVVDPTPEPGYVTHVVKKGEKLWSIAARYYGNGSLYRKILEANPGVTAQNLQVGAELRIPDPTSGGGASAAPHADTPDTPPAGGRREVTVRKGDTLWTIAKRELGAGARYREIIALNRDRISDPDHVPAGTVLLLP